MGKKLGLLLCILVLFVLTGCGKKEVLTAEKFEEVLTKEGFSVTDVTSALDDKTIKSVLTANNGIYQVEFYVTENDKRAKEIYENNRNVFKENETKSSKQKEISKTDYEKYTFELENQYEVIIRNKNTMVYASLNSDNKKSLNKIIDKLNY